MTLKKVVIQGETFKDDIVKFVPDDRFVSNAFISSSIDPDLLGQIKEYDNGIKIMIFPTPRVEDTGAQKYSLQATYQTVRASIYYRKIDREFKEIL